MRIKMFSIFLFIAIIAQILTGCTSKTEENNSTNNNSKDNTTNEVEVAAVDKTKVFVEPDWVKSVIDNKQPESNDYVIIEVAWGAVEDNKNYLEAHIPGGVHLNTDEFEEPTYWNIRSGEEIQELMAKYGITKDTTVIVYGADSGAARFAFVCLWAGVENVKVINGGLTAWKKAGYETNSGIENPVATTADFGVTIPANPEYTLAMADSVIDEMEKNDKFRLVSIRSLDEFEGKTSGYSYIENKGEPLGALWGHDEVDYYNEDGTFIDFDQAVAMWKEQGVTEENDIAFYCGTGWRAAIPWLMAYENGWKNIQLYDGGWFVWQMDPNNPVQAISPEEAAARYK